MGAGMSGECDDCGEHVTDCRCKEMQATKQVWNNGWISVKDRLPKDDQTVLVFKDPIQDDVLMSA